MTRLFAFAFGLVSFFYCTPSPEIVDGARHDAGPSLEIVDGARHDAGPSLEIVDAAPRDAGPTGFHSCEDVCQGCAGLPCTFEGSCTLGYDDYCHSSGSFGAECVDGYVVMWDARYTGGCASDGGL